jgi:hypothetical protein
LKNVKIKIGKTLSFTCFLREEHRLRVFENMVLRRVSKPRREEVTAGWRKLDNKGLHNLYFFP